jgi:hypothetical protein
MHNEDNVGSETRAASKRLAALSLWLFLLIEVLPVEQEYVLATFYVAGILPAMAIKLAGLTAILCPLGICVRRYGVTGLRCASIPIVFLAVLIFARFYWDLFLMFPATFGWR